MKTLAKTFLQFVFLTLLALTGGTEFVAGQSKPTHFLTLTNPNPVAGSEFGWSVAAVGTDRILIGAPAENTSAINAGAAYLFSTHGDLITAFTNPTPAEGDFFGRAVAAVGTDRVLISAYLDDTGARDAGSVYLFKTNGVLLTTLTNPAPAFDFFGESVTAVGTDRVLIGASLADKGATDSGAAYLFTTSGNLLTTFTNPKPEPNAFFGHSVAAVGTGHVLISAPRGATGAAYLFSTNGTLLRTFTSPRRADQFGSSVAGVGTDRVLIGANMDHTGAPYAGAAYLFSTTGALLTTFTNLIPASTRFGEAVAAMGTDHLLIGAPFASTGADGAGAVELFSTKGTWLNSLANPSPVASGNFGGSVAVVGTEFVLIGAWRNEPESAYLFKIDSLINRK